jgi:hypothetical protein
MMVLFVPTIGYACPYCAGQEGGQGTLLLMASMILLPFGIAGVVYKVIKRVNAREESELMDNEQALGENR